MWTWMVDLYSESEVADGIVGAEPPAVPEHAPAIDRLLFDDVGNLWVRSSPVGHPEPPTWFIFNETGVLTHSLTTDLDPVQIGDDFVLAIRHDELGVSRIAVFPLHKQ